MKHLKYLKYLRMFHIFPSCLIHSLDLDWPWKKRIRCSWIIAYVFCEFPKTWEVIAHPERFESVKLTHPDGTISRTEEKNGTPVV